MATEDESISMSLLLQFDDQSSSFVYGFEAGTVWQRMTNGENIIERPIPYRVENHKLLLRMAAVMGYDTTSETLPGDYISITFKKQLKVRSFSIVGKQVTPLYVFHDMLMGADWFYTMSDSEATQERGRKQFAHLREIAKQSEDHAKLFNDMNAYVNDGKPFPVRPEPKG